MRYDDDTDQALDVERDDRLAMADPAPLTNDERNYADERAARHGFYLECCRDGWRWMVASFDRHRADLFLYPTAYKTADDARRAGLHVRLLP